MGHGLIERYKNIKPAYKIAFFSAIVIGLLVHFYKFTNTLLNHDSIYNFYSDQNVLGSGRWFLSIACGISSYYDLPWVNGILSILYIALTVVIIVELFRIENPIVIILTSGLLVTFPGTTETLFFNFTADGFFLAMLLAASGVSLSRIRSNAPPPWTLPLSCLCICLSCGIYQAYVSFALVLSLCHLVYELFENRHTDKDILRWIRQQILVYSIAMIAYYVIWKLCMQIQGVNPTDYQGISNVANLKLSSPIQGIIRAVRAFILYFVQWNVLEHGFTLYSVLNIVFMIVMAGGVFAAIIKSCLYRRKLHLLLFCLASIALIPFACIWCLISDTVTYRPMMLLSLAILYIFTGILFDRWVRPRWSNLVGLFLTVIIFHNALLANISYLYMHQCSERTYAESIQLMERINWYNSTYDIDHITVTGNRLLDVQLSFLNEDTGHQTQTASSHILTAGLETSLLFDNVHTMLYLQNVHGLKIPFDSEIDPEIANDMGIWPAADSIRVVDSTLVIKIGEIKD